MPTISGTVKDSAGNGVSRIVRAYRKDTGILQATTTSTAGTGAFSLSVPTYLKHMVVREDAVTDPSCVVLMHFDGANAGSTFTEETGKAVTRVGTPVTSTAKSKYGGSAVLFNGSTDALTIPSSSDVLLGSGDFAIEFDILPTALPTAGSYAAMVGKYSSAGSRSYSIELYNASGVYQVVVLLSSIGTSADYYLYADFTPSLTAFSHLELSRSGGTVYLFGNGALLGTIAVGAAALYANTEAFSIGARANGAFFYYGYIDELRVRKQAGHTSAYVGSLPTEPYSQLIAYGSNALVFDDVLPI